MGKAKISNKTARELLAYALSKGFTWNGKLTGGGHIMLRHPGGGSVLLAATPGRKTSPQNSIKDIDREARRGGDSTV
jgi:hypothetical protein